MLRSGGWLALGDGRGVSTGELRTGPDAELPIDPTQVRLHRLHAHEEPLRGFLVGDAQGDDIRDPSLRLAELGRRSGATSDPRQGLIGPRLPEGCPEYLELRPRRLEGGACLPLPPHAS